MVEQVEPWTWKYCSRQRYPVRVCWLVFPTLTLGCTAFANSACCKNWASLYEALSILPTKKNGCSQGNCTSLSTLNKKILSTFNFVPKLNGFLPKILPVPHNFVKHTQSEDLISRNFTRETKIYFWSFSKLNSLLKTFFVISASNCSSASLPSVYLTV